MSSTVITLILNFLLFADWTSAVRDLAVRDETSFPDGCSTLATIFPSKVFYSGSTVYTYENQQFWSETEILTPECVFRPTCAGDVAVGVALLRLSDGEFAVRGGGHMGIKVFSKLNDSMNSSLNSLPGFKQYQRWRIDGYVKPDHTLDIC
jgi:hypothetical protein